MRGGHDRAQAHEPRRFGGEVVAQEVEMHSILHDLRFRDALEEQTWSDSRRLDQHGRVVFDVVDAGRSQAFELGFVVRRDGVAVERGRPESSQRRGVPAIDDDVVNPSHARSLACFPAGRELTTAS